MTMMKITFQTLLVLGLGALMLPGSLSAANRRPEVQIFPPGPVVIPEAAQLSGTASDDGAPAESTLTFAWSKVRGPGHVTITPNANVGYAATAVFSVPGEYVIRLEASDGDLTGAADLTVMVGRNRAPTLGLSVTEEVRLPAEGFLNAMAEDDGYPREPGYLVYTFERVSGPGPVAFSSEGAGARAQFSMPGDYRFKAIVFDGEFTVESEERLIRVLPPLNRPPTVSLVAQTPTIRIPAVLEVLAVAEDDGLPDPPASLTYQFSSSGPAPAAIQSEASGALIGFSMPGQYNITVTVSDGDQTATASTSITVLPRNEAPTFSLVAQSTLIHLPNEGGFQAIATDDGRPDPPGALTYRYSVSGPAAATVTAVDAGARVAFSGPGEYVVSVEVSDGERTASDSVTVTVRQNRAPTVELVHAADPVPLPARFEILAVAEDDGLPELRPCAPERGAGDCPAYLTYSFSVAGPGSAEILHEPLLDGAIIQFSEGGDYTVSVTVSDGDKTGSASTTVRVLPRNRPPTVVLEAQTTSVQLPAPLEVVANGQDDGLPNPPATLTYLFSASGPAAATVDSQGNAALIFFSAPGTYAVDVSVSDGELVGTDSRTVIVRAANEGPSVSAGDDRQAPVGSPFTLEAAVSSPGSDTEIQWTVVQEPGELAEFAPNGASLRALASVPGTYVFRIEVRSGGQTVFDTVTVEVLGANRPPVVSAGEDRVVRSDSLIVTLEGTATDDGLPNDRLTMGWRLVQGPPIRGMTRLGAMAKFELSAYGVYIFEFMASDGEETSIDSVQVIVRGAESDVRRISGSVGEKLRLDSGMGGTYGVTGAWRVAEGPGAALFDPIDQLVTTVQFMRPGRYRVEFRGSAGGQAIDQVFEADIAAAAKNVLNEQVGAMFNPNREEAVINVAVARPGQLVVSVFDRRMRLVREVYRGEASAGENAIRWDGRNNENQRVASGLYIVRIDRPGESPQFQKIISAR